VHNGITGKFMKLIPWLSVVVVVSATVGSLFLYKNSLSQQQQGQAQYEPVATVTATRAKVSAYQKRLSVIGESQAVKYITLKNELAGKISKINFSSGDTVERGSILLEFDHNEENASLAAAKANSLLKLQTFNRYKLLVKEKRISEESVDIAKAEYQVAIAEISRIEAIIEKKVFIAPFTANTGIHNLSVGQYLDSNTDITQLIGVETFTWVDFKVPQTYQQLTVGSDVDITISTDASAHATATINSIEPLLTQDSRQLKYRAKVLNRDLMLKPNYLVKVAVPIMDKVDVVTVPKLAIVRDQLGDYVFKLVSDENGDYRATRHKVELGDRIQDRVIISQGLNEHDLVAAKGAFKLREGLKTQFDDKNLAE
jgi:membrane fusion protein (multidrug efflux system)